jgi:hypothetical protein
MAEFRDAQGQSWPIEITGAVVKRAMQSPLAVDLGEPFAGDEPLVSRLGSVIFLVDLLWVICRPLADERGLDETAFAQALGGEALAAAHAALLEALALFFRSLARPEAAEAIRRQREAAERVIAEGSRLLADPEVDRALEGRIATLREEARRILAGDRAEPGS